MIINTECVIVFV